MLTVRDGVVAATVSLGSGSDALIDDARIASPDDDRVLLFGSSDLLLITRNAAGFDGGPIQVSSEGRAANWYFALSIRLLNDDDQARPFRGLSFFRLQRPDFDRLGLARLRQVIEAFSEICVAHNVAAEAMLGYGWADFYIDIRARRLTNLLASIVACRAITLEGRPVFRNSFTIVGVDLKHRVEAASSTEAIRPSVAMRIAPNDLSRVIASLRREFDAERWDIEITTGKRDIVLTPNAAVEFREFWRLHQELRTRLARDSAIYKIETHLQFPPETILGEGTPPPGENTQCRCANAAEALHDVFLRDLSRCPDSVGRGQKKSLEGLAHHYRETLQDRDSCCDFDAAAAHFYSQRRLIHHYLDMVEHSRDVEGYPAEEGRTRRRLELYREAFQRLDVSASMIFQQEQNGSYPDLLTRSERVSLFRGGVQKMNTVLLAALHALVDRYGLPISPMLCWWPAGQIQSERPIGVIKVPIFFLHQPEIALFLVIHELGQIAAYEYLRTAGDAADDGESGLEEPRFPSEEGAELKPLGISTVPVQLQQPEAWLSKLERDSVDTGALLTDIFADLFLLNVGFNDDMMSMRLFLFEQFLQLEQVQDAYAPRGGKAYSVFLITRLIAMAAASERMRKGVSANVPLTFADILDASDDALAFIDAAVAAPRFEKLIKKTGALERVLRNRAIFDEAKQLTRDYEMWVRKAMEFAQQFSPPAPAAELAGEREIASGEIRQIDCERIGDYFLRLLDVPEDDEDLFRARAALIASVIISCEPRRRLGAARESLERESVTTA